MKGRKNMKTTNNSSTRKMVLKPFWRKVIAVFSISMQIMSVLLIIWVLASWVNVACNNLTVEASQNIWNWNFFAIFFD